MSFAPARRGSTLNAARKTLSRPADIAGYRSLDIPAALPPRVAVRLCLTGRVRAPLSGGYAPLSPHRSISLHRLYWYLTITVRFVNRIAESNPSVCGVSPL